MNHANRCCLLLGWALLAAPSLHAQAAIGEVFASDASVRGSVVLTEGGMRVLSGSQVSAGDAAAVLKLARGGEVRVCPKTNLSVSADASGKSLVLGMNEGAMEVDYPLESTTDSLLTPDFRLQLISPGDFHFAISVSASGDTCLRALRGNSASVFVAEMMGTESYQLSPGKSVLFKAGKISRAMEAPQQCGCPATKAEPRAAQPENVAPSQAARAQVPGAESHMEVESTFVYRGKSAQPEDLSGAVARLSISKNNSQLALALLPKVSGPTEGAAPAKKEKKPGVFQRLGRFMGRLFGK